MPAMELQQCGSRCSHMSAHQPTVVTFEQQFSHRVDLTLGKTTLRFLPEKCLNEPGYHTTTNNTPLFTTFTNPNIPEMDETTTLTAFSNLIERYPQLDMTLISDVLQACDQDVERAYSTLCEMVIPAEESLPSVTNSTSSEKPSPPGVHPPVHYTIPTHNSEPLTTPTTPRHAPPQQPQGAWGRTNMGRRLRIDEMCTRYNWIRRSVVEALFEKNGDCLELVENDIIAMFPVDEPAAFADAPTSTRRPRGPAQSRQRAVAESLRAQAQDEIRRTGFGGVEVSMASADMQAMRKRLWETREMRASLHNLASQTRKAEHVATAKEKDEELERLSAQFLSKIRQSVEYRNGVVDLHGLTKDEAIQIVEWKLQEGGRKRFRLITGKGNHSRNYQAVLRPALEKHFTSTGVSFTQVQDGILSVIFP